MLGTVSSSSSTGTTSSSSSAAALGNVGALAPGRSNVGDEGLIERVGLDCGELVVLVVGAPELTEESVGNARTSEIE